MLTDMTVRLAKATGKPYTIADCDGLSLFVSAKGSKAWYFRYTWVDKRSRIPLGSYPELSLREARELRDQARSLVAKGINPRTDRQHAPDHPSAGLADNCRARGCIAADPGPARPIMLVAPTEKSRPTVAPATHRLRQSSCPSMHGRSFRTCSSPGGSIVHNLISRLHHRNTRCRCGEACGPRYRARTRLNRENACQTTDGSPNFRSAS